MMKPFIFYTTQLHGSLNLINGMHYVQHVLIGYAAIIYSVFASSIASPVCYPGHHIQQQQRTPLIFCLRFDLAGERADILLNLTLVVW